MFLTTYAELQPTGEGTSQNLGITAGTKLRRGPIWAGGHGRESACFQVAALGGPDPREMELEPKLINAAGEHNSGPLAERTVEVVVPHNPWNGLLG